MYPVSNAYVDAISAQTRTDKIKVEIRYSNQEICCTLTDDDIEAGTLTVSRQCVNNGYFEFGTAYASELQFSTKTSKITPFSIVGYYASVTYCLKLADGTFEDVPVGIFRITECDFSKGHRKITAYDCLTTLDWEGVGVTISGTATPYELLKGALFMNESAYHARGLPVITVELGNTEAEISAMPNGTEPLKIADDMQTAREIISSVAELLGCFVEADKVTANTIRLRQFASQPVRTISPNLRYNYEVDVNWDRPKDISTQIGYRDDGSKIKTPYAYLAQGTGSFALTGGYRMNLNNKILNVLGETQAKAIADNLASALSALNQTEYIPIGFTFVGDPALDVGDMLMCEYNGTRNPSYIGGYTWNYRNSENITAISGNKETDISQSPSGLRNSGGSSDGYTPMSVSTDYGYLRYNEEIGQLELAAAVGKYGIAYDGQTTTGEVFNEYHGGNKASGAYSHAEGAGTQATNSYAHAEGTVTTASGQAAHAEGAGTQAIGSYAHAEGMSTLARGVFSHAEGNGTAATGNGSHAEGMGTKADLDAAHAEGQNTTASGKYSHAEGSGAIASGESSHAEGVGSVASGVFSHAEGYSTKASGPHAHTEGAVTTASGQAAHAEGIYSSATGAYSHAEGSNTTAVGAASHAEGLHASASGDYSHAEGANTKANKAWSHAEGQSTTADGNNSHAEGGGTTASGAGSHAEGGGTTASGANSHAGGGGTTASGANSYAGGLCTIAASADQTAIGKYNISDADDIYAFIVGNGTVDARSNAFTVAWDGTVTAEKYIGANANDEEQGLMSPEDKKLLGNISGELYNHAPIPNTKLEEIFNW